MVDFNGKILIIGCGSVTQCALPILLTKLKTSPKNITVLDFVDNRKKIESAINAGVHYVQKQITKENYSNVLQTYLKKGDLCLDLAWNLDTVSMIEWCHTHDVLYINTSVEVWEPFADYNSGDPTRLTLYHRQMLLRDMLAKRGDKKGPTAIVDHGANPGLVSHFVKQGLIDIATKIVKEEKDSKRRKELEAALAEGNFPQLAHLSGLKTVHISERDTQITNDPKKVDEFVNTWSVEGFMEEGLAPAEMGWGTHERELPPGAFEHHRGPKNQICLPQKGVDTWVRSWVPSGDITGMVIRHGEAFSISDYLTVWQGSEPIYRPTVHYAYCPCDSAINSLHELEMRRSKPQVNQRILNNEIIEGKEELGCLLMGHDFKSWWIGSILNIHQARNLVPGQSATTVQVAIGVVSAVLYAMKHPSLGFCLPDHLDYREILSLAKPFLGEFVSKPVDWSPLKDVEAFSDFNEEPPQAEEEWQFNTFRVNFPRSFVAASIET